jgi:transcriptional repressor NF-X1
LQGASTDYLISRTRIHTAIEIDYNRTAIMETATPQAPAPPNAASRGRRRGRRGRGGADATTSTQSHTQEPVQQTQAPTPSTDPSNHRGRPRRGGFGRGRGGRGGISATTQPMVNGQRAFGGQLTVPSAPGSLAGDAPEFVPGRPIVARGRGQAQQGRGEGGFKGKRVMEKSQAKDISTRIHEDIGNGQYECGICTNEVLPNSKVWSCKTCEYPLLVPLITMRRDLY